MKKIILLFIIVFLSGCSATADIKVNYDLTVDENIQASFSNAVTLNYNSPQEYAYEFLNYYNSAISLKKYNYKFQGGKEDSKVLFDKSNDSICDFVKYNLFSQLLYKKVECTEDEYYFTIYSQGNQYVSSPQDEKIFNLEQVTLSVTLPVEAEEHNSDLKNDLTYIWNYNQDTPSEKSIYLKISKEKIESNKRKIEVNKLEEQKKKNMHLKLILILGLSILIGVTLLYLRKKYKNNQVEY